MNTQNIYISIPITLIFIISSTMTHANSFMVEKKSLLIKQNKFMYIYSLIETRS